MLAHLGKWRHFRQSRTEPVSRSPCPDEGPCRLIWIRESVSRRLSHLTTDRGQAARWQLVRTRRHSRGAPGRGRRDRLMVDGQRADACGVRSSNGCRGLRRVDIRFLGVGRKRRGTTILRVANLLQGLRELDPKRVGALAICASSGYVALAASEDTSLRSISMVAPWLHNAELVCLIYGGEQSD